MRRFVALEVSARGRATLAKRLEPLRELPLGWTRPEGWHLTLAFCGDVADEHAAVLERVVADAVVDAGAQAFELTTAAAQVLGGHALALAVEDRPAGAVATLATRLQDAIEAAELPVARRRVRPHVTLARAREDRSALMSAVGAVDQAVSAGAPVTWRATEVVVCRSELGRGPARYPVEARVPLG